ncbi:MAG: hypothetical protein FD131_3419 [Rhodocyclaceae bacterium]|uniref:hypothetical protein n=1 Tax=Achromobacter ruhlandii TaxID=72557 RepID=UPI0011D99959|nr:hypothetical protein [Achromobacter ruhlandii]TXT28039.1 MAG: hypothetical protein FD131_3419 [Rhodocyclaceae bacterium]
MIGYATGNKLGIGNTGQYCNTAGMADSTITVDARELAFGIFSSIVSLMLVLVVTKMMRSGSRFMLAIGSRHRPGSLE